MGLTLTFQDSLDAPPDPNLGLDHIQYAWIANDLYRGNGYRMPVNPNPDDNEPTAFRPPGTPLLICGIYHLTGQKDIIDNVPHPANAAVRVSFALLGALTLLPLYWTVRQLGSQRHALLAAAALAFWPSHAYYSMHFFSEVPWTFLLTAAMGLSVALCKKPHWAPAVLQGLLLGYATLIRPIAFFFPFIQAGLLLLFHYDRKNLFPKALASCVVCSLCLLPWGLRNHGQFGEWIFFTSHGGTTFYGCHNERIVSDPSLKGRWLSPEETPRQEWILEVKGEKERDERAYQAAFEWLEENMHLLPDLTLWKFIRTFEPNPRTPNAIFNHAVGWPWALLIPFLLFGCVRMFRLDHRSWIALATPVGMILLMTLVWYGDHRFRISIIPTLLAIAIVALPEKWLARK